MFNGDDGDIYVTAVDVQWVDMQWVDMQWVDVDRDPKYKGWMKVNIRSFDAVL